MKRTYRNLVVLASTGAAAGAAALTSAPVAAGIFSAEPLAADSTVALAQPVDGTRWNLVIVERIQPGTGCWQSQANGMVTLEADALSNEAQCNRLQSSSGYSLRAAGEDLRSPWRLRIEAVNNQLELQAFNPSLTGPITIGTAPLTTPGNGATLASFNLKPGWTFQKRSYQGRLLTHVYLNSKEPMAVLMARSNGSRAASKVTMPPALSTTNRTAREPQPGQVISLQVVPFRDDANLTASSQ